VLTGDTYTKTATTITGSVVKGTTLANNVALEILDGSNVVIRRKNTASPGGPNNTQVTAQVTGLVAGTAYNCRMQRGDVALADI
jgi:flagellar hook assembly protein FlgD